MHPVALERRDELVDRDALRAVGVKVGEAALDGALRVHVVGHLGVHVGTQRLLKLFDVGLGGELDHRLIGRAVVAPPLEVRPRAGDEGPEVVCTRVGGAGREMNRREPYLLRWKLIQPSPVCMGGKSVLTAIMNGSV